MSIEATLSKFGRTLDKVFGDLRNAINDLTNYRSSSLKHRMEQRYKTTASITSSHMILLFDSFLAFLSIFISIHLRIGMDFLDYSPSYILKNMLVFSLVSSSIFLWLQTHQSFWRYTTIEDMTPIFLSVILSNILFFPLMMLMNQGDFLPYSVLFINVFVLSIMLLVPRFLTKVVYNHKINKIRKFDAVERRSISGSTPAVIIVGDSGAVESFSREVITNEDVDFNFDPVGVLTLEPADIGRTIKGVPILGELRDIQRVMSTLNKEGIHPKQIIIAEKQLPENAMRFLSRYAEMHGLLLMHVMFQFEISKV